MLPQQPLTPASVQQALTREYLDPDPAALLRLCQAARAAVDPRLCAARPAKGGKAYPLGQCLEISQGVLEQLRTWLAQPVAHDPPSDAAAGLTRLRAFLAAGGELRLVWGVLRERYFQNAFQLGAWYVDVANDTVDPTKPPVEILPFDDSGLVAVADFAHFARIAREYWGGHLYPNHLFPALAPYFPLISDVPGIGLRLQAGNDYMIALNQAQAFRSARDVLADGTVPDDAIRRVAAVLAPGALGFDPSDGPASALLAYQQEQVIGEPEAMRRRDQAVARYLEINRRLTAAPRVPPPASSRARPHRQAPQRLPPPASPAELIRTAQARLMRDPTQAAADFAAALHPQRIDTPPASPLERARLGLCLGLAHFRLNRIADSLAASGPALQLAATLPWPPPAPAPPIRFDARAAEQQLQELLAALCAAGLHAFATGGALLGLVREGRLMDNDRDLDVVVPIDEFDRACAFVADHDWQPAWIPVAARNFRAFVHGQSGLTLDLIGYAFDAEAGHVLGGWWPPGQAASAGRLLAFSPIALVQRSSPCGPLWAAAQPEQLLAELYGPGWREPDPDYEPLLGTPALVRFNAYTRALGYLRLLEAWSAGRRERARRLLESLRQRSPEDPVPPAFSALAPPAAPTVEVIGGAIGAFDLLHVGHLRFLRAARGRCDRLKVAVCTERTAWNSKGRTPVIPLDQRLEMVRALDCVDEACVFDGALAATQAAADWIQAWGLRHLFVSQDWAGSARWQALEPELRARGIVCTWLPATPGISTSAIRARIQQDGAADSSDPEAQPASDPAAASKR